MEIVLETIDTKSTWLAWLNGWKLLNGSTRRQLTQLNLSSACFLVLWSNLGQGIWTGFSLTGSRCLSLELVAGRQMGVRRDIRHASYTV
jgi:hypothetical protein